MIAVVLPVLHPFLMSNSHPLRSFFTTFQPVYHPLLPVVVATVPFFFPTVSEAVHSDSSIHLLCGPERPPAICKSFSNLLLLATSTVIARAIGQYGRQQRHLLGGGSVGSSKAMENLWGKGALQCRRLRYNKARRGEAIPQCKATQKTGPKVKATCHLWSLFASIGL